MALSNFAKTSSRNSDNLMYHISDGYNLNRQAKQTRSQTSAGTRKIPRGDVYNNLLD